MVDFGFGRNRVMPIPEDFSIVCFRKLSFTALLFHSKVKNINKTLNKYLHHRIRIPDAESQTSYLCSVYFLVNIWLNSSQPRTN